MLAAGPGIWHASGQGRAGPLTPSRACGSGTCSGAATPRLALCLLQQPLRLLQQLHRRLQHARSRALPLRRLPLRFGACGRGERCLSSRPLDPVCRSLRRQPLLL